MACRAMSSAMLQPARSGEERCWWMGGTGGINWFDTDKVKQHPWQAKVTISGLLVGTKPVYTGIWNRASILSHIKGPTTATSSPYLMMTIPHHPLSTLTYNNVEQISYAYSINGEDWRTIQSGMNEAIILPHASRHLQVPCQSYLQRIRNPCQGVLHHRSPSLVRQHLG